MVRDLFGRVVWGPAARKLPVTEPQLAANLIATQVLGLVMSRCMICVEPLASLPAEAVIE